jgi:hypothetical protein
MIFALLQIWSVEHLYNYLTSFLLLQALAAFVIAAYIYLKNHSELSSIFKTVASLNIVFLIIALVILPIFAVRSEMWYLISISPNVPLTPRLKMFTFEASYYSFIITPIVGYYLLKKILLRSHYNILFISLCVSLVLSFSLGVIATIIISLMIIMTMNWNELRNKVNYNILSLGIILFVVAMLSLYAFYSHNPLFERLRNIYNGEDTSARGRTYEAFHIAWNVAKMKSLVFGCGLGQLKYIGRDFVDYYYSYSKIPTTIRIPNAVAETLCVYGITGIVARFSIIIFLFIKAKVWNNYYRQFLFCFVFIYQFSGSYLFNPAEYMIWILAFSPNIFPSFNKAPKELMYKPILI